jgi:hypothetical protein
MNFSRKAVFSFLITLALAALLFTAGRFLQPLSGGLRFYDPRLTRAFQAETDADALMVRAFFTLNGSAVEEAAGRSGELREHLRRQGRIKAGEDVLMLPADPPALILGLSPAETLEISSYAEPRDGTFFPEAFFPKTFLNERGLPAQFNKKTGSLSLPVLEIRGVPQLLFWAAAGPGLFVGRLRREDLFELPRALGYLLFPAFFISLWLSAFFILSLRRSPPRILERRTALLREALVKKTQGELLAGGSSFKIRLKERREDLRRELLRGLGKKNKELNRLFDLAWDELLEALPGPNEAPVIPLPPEPEIFEFLEAVSEIEEDLPPEEQVEMIDEDRLIYKTPLRGKQEGTKVGNTNGREDREGQNPEELEDLEELEELEELPEGELEVLEEEDTPVAEEAPRRPDFGALASEIEFAPVSEIDEDELDMGEDLEIVDPFSDMLSDLSGEEPPNDTGGREKGDVPDSPQKNGPAKDLKAGAFYALYADGLWVELDEPRYYLPAFGKKAPWNEEVIREKNGLHRINTRYFSPDQETLNSLDGEFKKLIDAVLLPSKASLPRRKG